VHDASLFIAIRYPGLVSVYSPLFQYTPSDTDSLRHCEDPALLYLTLPCSNIFSRCFNFRRDSRLPTTSPPQPPEPTFWPTLTMTSPTKSQSHTSRLFAQIAELSAQRDQLITEMLPLIPADVLASAERDNTAEVEASDDAAESADVEPGRADKAAPADIAGGTTADTTNSEAAPTKAGPSSPSTTDTTLTESTRAAVLEHASHTVQQHISLLHAYNGIRDIGQNVMGMLAEQRGIRVVQVMEECGVGEGD
jgi:hypothetical protein